MELPSCTSPTSPTSNSLQLSVIHDDTHSDSNTNSIKVGSSNNFQDNIIESTADSDNEEKKQKEKENITENESKKTQLQTGKKDEIFWHTVGVLVMSILFGCGFIIFWFWFYSYSIGIEFAMKLTLSSIESYAISKIENEFYVSQTILQLMIGSVIYTHDIPADEISMNNGDYDKFFASFVNGYGKSTNAIYDCYIYNPDENIMVGTRRKEYNSDQLLVMVYNQSCYYNIEYNYQTRSRDRSKNITNLQCDYIPKKRSWYKLSQEIINNTDSNGYWTNPYEFATSNKNTTTHIPTYGSSLVKNLKYNDVNLVLVVEFTFENFETIMESFSMNEKPLLNGILYVATENYQVISSTVNEMHLSQCEYSYCQATNDLLLNTINFINQTNQFANNNYNHSSKFLTIDNKLVLVAPFSMVRPTTVTNYANQQIGYIVIAYTNDYWHYINIAAFWSIFCVCLVLISITCVAIATKIRQVSLKDEMTAAEIEKPDKAAKTDKTDNSNSYNNKMKRIVLVARLVVVLTLASSYGIWNVAINETMKQLLENKMKIQEHETTLLKINEMVKCAEMSYNIVKEEFLNQRLLLDDEFHPLNNNETNYIYDNFLLNMRKAFETGNGQVYNNTRDTRFIQYTIQLGFPNGVYILASTNAGKQTLRMAEKSQYTNWFLEYYETINNTVRDIENGAIEGLGGKWFDPRCRSWYQKSIIYAFNGTLEQAFPYVDINNKSNRNSFSYWYGNQSEMSYDTDGCIEARDNYQQLWDLKKLYATNTTNETDTDFEYVWNRSAVNEIGDKGTWTVFHFASNVIGISYSKPFVNETTGDLIAIISINYQASKLSELILESITHLDDKSELFGEEYKYNRFNDLNTNSVAWIFEAIENDTTMIATSDSNGTEYVSNNIQGIDSNTDELISYQALTYPRWIINVISKVIVNAIGINNIPIVTDLENGAETLYGCNSLGVDTTFELPNARTSVFEYVNEYIGFKWILVSLTDIKYFDNLLQDVKITALIALVLFTFLAFYFLPQLQPHTKTMETSEYNNTKNNKCSKSLSKVLKIVKDDVNMALKKSGKTTGPERAHQAIKDLRYFGNKSSLHDNFESFIFEERILRANNQIYRLQFVEIFGSKIYVLMIEFVMLLHILCIFFEPQSIEELRKNDGWQFELVIFVTCAIFIEYLDLGVEFVIREIRFDALTKNNTYKALTRIESNSSSYNYERFWNTDNSFFGSFVRVLVGPGRRRFLLRLLLTTLIFANFLIINWFKLFDLAIFSYYIPIVPILLMIKNDNIYNALKHFMTALSFGNDVLLSYFCYILVCALFGLVIFDEKNRDTIVNSYSFIPESLTTTFVLGATQENYNDVFYSALNNSVNSKIIVIIYFVTLVIISIFIAVPILIEKFTQSYKIARKDEIESLQKQKRYSIIVAFIDLDTNRDNKISGKELRTLLNILHNNNDENDQFLSNFDIVNELNIDQFYSEMEKCQDRIEATIVNLENFKWIDKLTQRLTKAQQTNYNKFQQRSLKYQAYLECRVFTQDWIRSVSLLFGIVPILVCLCLAGLTGLFDLAGDFKYCLVFCYVYNILEILLTMCAFGHYGRRCFNFDQFPNPPLVEAAIQLSKKESSQTELQVECNKISKINISEEEIKWVKNILQQTREPLRAMNIWDKKKFAICFRFDFFVLLLSTLGLVYDNIIINGDGGDRLTIFWLSLPLLRLFTVLSNNRELILRIVCVVKQLLSLLVFSMLIIIIWARVGLTLFENKSKVIINEIYDGVENSANFNSLFDSMLALLQLMIGEGWNDVMFINILATQYSAIFYFVTYIIIVTLLLNQIIVGSMLAGMDNLEDKIGRSRQLFNKN